MAPAEKADPAKIVTKAKRLATQAINKAAVVKGDTTRNRSTTTREVYKIKADALDQIALVLTGKDVKK